MRILGIDTATSTASVALVENGTIIADKRYLQTSCSLASKSGQPAAGHAEIILLLIESILVAARCSVTNLDGIAVSIGPGSFTGLRIGLSTVKGLAYGRQCPVVGVSTLWANAARVTDFAGIVCSLLDARKKEVYVSFFRRSREALARLTEDTLAPLSVAIEQARHLAGAAPCLFVGEGAKVYEDALNASFANNGLCCAGDRYPSLASAVARLGEKRLRVSDGDVLSAMAPVYLRLSEAEVKRKERG